MGWVTLTLRKTELKRSHTDYQNELLQISREKRQKARQYAYQQSEIRNRQAEELRWAKADYDAARKSGNAQLSSATNNGGTTGVDDNGDGSADRNATNVEIQNSLDQAREDYQFETNEIRTRYEDELAMIEHEANDVETDLDQQQVGVEAQLEAISAEIEAVGEAISSQIQASTIKLS